MNIEIQYTKSGLVRLGLDAFPSKPSPFGGDVPDQSIDVPIVMLTDDQRTCLAGLMASFNDQIPLYAVYDRAAGKMSLETLLAYLKEHRLDP